MSSGGSSWEKRFDELRQYLKEHGDCLVPARYSQNPRLGHWVMAQRRQYALLMQGKPSSLCEERVVKLEEVGFAWRVRESNDTLWRTRFMELKKYSEEFGDCLVPQRYGANPPLGIWVSTQRRHYKLLTTGKKSIMTRERVCELEKIGFQWDLQDASKRKKACSTGKVGGNKSTFSKENIQMHQSSPKEIKEFVSLPRSICLQNVSSYNQCFDQVNERSASTPNRPSDNSFSSPPQTIVVPAKSGTFVAGHVLAHTHDYPPMIQNRLVICDGQQMKLVGHPHDPFLYTSALNCVPHCAINRSIVYKYAEN